MDLEQKRRQQAECQKRLRATRRVPKPAIVCPICGSKFQPQRSTAKFCGDICRMKNRSKKASN